MTMSLEACVTFHHAYTGDDVENEIERLEKFIAEEYQYTTWPTWSHDTTDPKERRQAAKELWEIMIKYVMHQYAVDYLDQNGRNPTLNELIRWAEAQNVVPNVEAEILR